MKNILFIISIIIFTNTYSQESMLPLKEIPAYPESYTPGNVTARMVEGLGYRYFWATEGLRDEDLAYKPSEDARDVRYTLEHLYDLSEMVLNSATSEPNIRPVESKEELSFEDLRSTTLLNLEKASKLFREMSEADFEQNKVVFERPAKTSEFPMWNMLNGPLSDALYHVGQIVSFRRTSGNPLPKGVNVFIGKTKK